MLLVAKRSRLFNTLACGILAFSAALAAGSLAVAAPGDDVPLREAPSPEPVLALEAPEGHCVYDAAEAARLGPCDRI